MSRFKQEKKQPLDHLRDGVDQGLGSAVPRGQNDGMRGLEMLAVVVILGGGYLLYQWFF
ncbi:MULTISPECIES: hypothetical protein [Exiguobacterium]|uniref:Uncharacterized protein n=1 Tax=Exiguobacterium acetylicum TaxID=41170 RepID=A0ABX8GD14_EXIAC|nr:MULTISPECIES: hypothetical protein [Exiguobacterium]QWB31505.1 hypothetical protein KKI46_07645 [Exiguobacterium acetylicum]